MKSKSSRAFPRIFLQVCLVAIAYYAMAQLGFFINGLANGIPVFFPAAGLALAVVLVGGWQMLIGIFLGALVSNQQTLGISITAPISIVLAIVPAAEAWIGAWVLHHWVDHLPPLTIRLVLRAIGLMALLALFASWLGVLGMIFSGYVQPENIWLETWHWWIGVYVGMLVVTPSFIIFIELRRRQITAESVAWLLASLMISVSLTTFVLTWDTEDRQLQSQFKADASETAHVIQDGVAANEFSLLAVHAFFDSSERVERDEFTRFITPLVKRSSSIKIIGWAPRVTNDQRATFEQSARQMGLNNYSIFQRDANNQNIPATTRAEYFPCIFFEPFAGNSTVLGFDLASEDTRLQAITRARETGQTVFTPAIHLAQSTNNQESILMLMAVYDRNAPLDTIDLRRANTLGIVYLAFPIDTFISNTLGEINPHDLALYVFDVSDAKPQLLTFHPASSDPQTAREMVDPNVLQSGLFYATRIELYGRTWQFIVRPGLAYTAQAHGLDAWIRLILGFGSTGVFLLYILMRQRAESRLRVNERRSQLLLRAIPDLMFRLTRDGVFLDYSASQTNKLYAPPGAFIGKSITTVMSPDIAQQCLNAIQASFNTGTLQTFEYELEIQDERLGFEARVETNAKDNEAIVIVRDVTEARRNLQALRQSEAQYRLISENTGDVIWILDLESQRFTYISPSVEKLRGYTQAEVMEQSLDQALTPESLAQVAAILPARLAEFMRNPTMASQIDELDQTRRDGSIVHTEVTSSFVVTDSGKTQVIGISRDITERKRAEEALRLIEQRNSALIQNAPDGIVLLDREGQFVFGSPSAFRMFGYTPAETLGQPALQWVHPDDVAQLHAQFVALAQDAAKSFVAEYRFLAKHGNYLCIEGHFTNLFADPSVKAIVNNFRDITLQKLADDQLKQSQANLELAQELAHLGSWELDPQTGTGLWSKEMFHLFQRDPAQGVPVMDDFLEMVAPIDRAGLLAAQQRAIETGERITTEYRVNPTPTLTRNFQATLYALKDERGQSIKMAGTVQDITERKQAEERLRRLNRTYAVLSQVNETIVRIHDQQALFESACHIAVDTGGFRMAWIGLIDPQTKRVNPVTFAGTTDHYLEDLDIRLDDSERGRGPTATALRAGKHMVVNDIANDPRMGPWRTRALNLEYRASAVFPLILFGEVRGALNLYAPEANIFDDDELKLYDEMANDISFAMEFIEQENQRKAAQDKLRASEHRSQVLLQAIPDLMFRMTPDGVIIDFAAQDAEHLYLQPEDFLGRKVADIMPPAVSEQWTTISQKAFETGELQTLEYQLNARGTDNCYEARIIANVTENELVSIIRNITVERQTSAQNRQLSRVVDQMDDQVVITDVNGTIIYVNPAFERQTGFTQAEALGHTPRILKSGLETIAYYENLWAVILRGDTFQSEIRNRKKSGELYYEAITITPIRNEHGTITHFVATGKDITARKQIERDLKERLKELTCLHRVQRILETDPILQVVCQQTAHSLVSAMQFPEITVGVVELDNQVFSSDDAALPVRTLAAPIVVGGTLRGRIAAHYIADQTFILPEEQDLLNNLAQTLGLWLERKNAQEALAEERNSLARRVDERTADLRQANVELARAARLKDEFLSSMSHELRTPLNGILGLSESLEEGVYGSLTPEQLSPLHTIAEAGHHLLDLINDILDLSKIEAGRLELHPEPIQVRSVCEASLRMIKQPAHQKKLRVNLAMDADIDHALADERRLKQMLVNLLGNAVKFTPEHGQIGIEVTVNATGEVLRFTVWDTGIGIAPDKINLLFQPFTQIDSSLTRQYAGTGLGLSLVRRLAELHGGSVGVTSEPGKGSRFYFELPLISAEPAQDLETSAPAPLQVKIALVVDDSITASDQLMRYLHELSAEVIVESTGANTVERAVVARPDVIMLDLLMPERSGWDVLTALKSDPRTRAIPVIITSVMDERARGIAAGAADFLVKPVTRESLRTALRRVAKQNSSALSASAAKPGTSPETKPADTVPVILLAEDNIVNQQMLETFLSAQGYRVVIAVNGAEAIERAEEFQPAIILMDIQMPVMDGLEAIQRLRLQPKFAQTPMIALTALAMPGDRERCLAAGATDYMTKPIGLKKLRARIESLLKPSALS